MAAPQRWAGVEAGGTSWVLSIAEGAPDNIVARHELPTTTPAEVLTNVVAWLKEQQPFCALGVASFGPVDLRKKSPTFGFITTTPKPGWRNVDVVGTIMRGLALPSDFPVGFDTDVNAPAMAEYQFCRDQGQDVDSCAYVTVGTGIGAGFVIHGQPVHGLLHPEAGHISVPRHPKDSTDHDKKMLACVGWEELEAMCSSHALAQRAGCAVTELANLPDDHLVWELTAHYLAAFCANMILMLSPEKIVLSGGIMQRKVLFPAIRQKTQEYLNTYIDVPALTTDQITQVIVPSEHGNKAGIIGALHLARNAYQQQQQPPPQGCPAVQATQPAGDASPAHVQQRASAGWRCGFSIGVVSMGVVCALALAGVQLMRPRP